MTPAALACSRRYLFVPFFLLSFLWAAVHRHWRKAALRRDRYRSHLPTISVGNIHSGGSAKTPLVLAICERLASMRPAILSRGYGGKRRDGAGGWLDLTKPDGPEFWGDEPWLLANNSGCGVWIGPKRADGARAAEAAGNGLLILDDGFQHLGLARDIDLVSIHTSRGVEDRFCLPLGDLREPVESLRHADAVLLAGERPEDEIPWREFLSVHFPGIPIFSARCQSLGLFDRDQPVELAAGTPVSAFCGIALPERFQSGLRKHFQLRSFSSFADHHVWTEGELVRLSESSVAKGVQSLICTEKDWTKLSSRALPQGVRWLHTRQRYELAPEFWQFLDSCLLSRKEPQ